MSTLRILVGHALFWFIKAAWQDNARRAQERSAPEVDIQSRYKLNKELEALFSPISARNAP
jgi:hypothetical protein